MSDWWGPALVVAGGVVLIWCALVIVLWAQQRRMGRSTDWRQAMRLIPDVIRLLHSLVRDRTIARVIRWTVIGLLGYLLLPIDLIPDAIPVLGIADDVIIAALVLRFVIRRAGNRALTRHWPGTEEGLRSIISLTGTRR